MREAPRRTALVAALSLLWLAIFAWPRPLALPDEGRYVGVAWEMVRSGDWLVPTLDGLPYFHKPPLFYWITSAAMTVFGPVEWAARAAPLLGAWVGAMATFLFVRHWWGGRAAGLALVVLLAQPLFYLGGQFANLDMLVAGFISATIVLLAHAALSFERGAPVRWPLVGAYLAAALGVLAKGLIGVVLPALVVGVWLVAGRRWRTLLALVSLPGSVVFLAVAAPWFIAMQGRFAEFLDYFFVVQHFKRFAAGGFNNVQPFWFYPAALLLLTLPWLPWLRPQFARRRLSEPGRGNLRLLMLLWAALIVGFFSLPASKLLGYILPAVPPLAVLLADGIESWRERWPRSARWWKLSAASTVVLSLATIVFMTWGTPQSSKPLGATLHALRGADEPVYMLDHYYFDLPLYGRLSDPARVVLDWTDPELRRRDDWRKELADAGDFAPARAKAVLIDPAQLAPSICAGRVGWVIGSAASGRHYPFLAAAQIRAQAKDRILWRVDSGDAKVMERLNCSGTPSSG